MPLLIRDPTPFHHTPTGSSDWGFFDEALAIASNSPSVPKSPVIVSRTKLSGVLEGAIEAAKALPSPSSADDEDKDESEEGEEEGEEEGALATPWDTPPPQQSRPLGKVRKGDEIIQGDKWFPEVVEISDDESGLGVLGVAPEVESGAEGGEEVMELDARTPCHPNIEEPRTPVRNPSSHTSTPPLTISSTTATTTPTPVPRTLFSPHTPPNHSSGGGGNINPPSTTARTSISPHTPPSIGCLNINIPISTLAVQNGITKDPFSVPSILLTDSFGNTLFMQRALITESLSSLRSLPIAIPATPLLSALTTQLATHAETLDRFGAWARTISSPGGALNIKMRQESAQHAWKKFLELREELREIRQAREEAVEVVEAWRAFERGDLAREGEEAGEGEEGEEGLGGFIEAYVREAGGVEWSADAVETLRVAAEGWTSRWLSFKQNEPEEVMQKKRKRKSISGEEEKNKTKRGSPREKQQKRESKTATKVDAKNVRSEGEILRGWIPEKWN